VLIFWVTWFTMSSLLNCMLDTFVYKNFKSTFILFFPYLVVILKLLNRLSKCFVRNTNTSLYICSKLCLGRILLSTLYIYYKSFTIPCIYWFTLIFSPFCIGASHYILVLAVSKFSWMLSVSICWSFSKIPFLWFFRSSFSLRNSDSMCFKWVSLIFKVT
jgi:hypothetical protein